MGQPVQSAKPQSEFNRLLVKIADAFLKDPLGEHTRERQKTLLILSLLLILLTQGVVKIKGGTAAGVDYKFSTGSSLVLFLGIVDAYLLLTYVIAALRDLRLSGYRRRIALETYEDLKSESEDPSNREFAKLHLRAVRALVDAEWAAANEKAEQRKLAQNLEQIMALQGKKQQIEASGSPDPGELEDVESKILRLTLERDQISATFRLAREQLGLPAVPEDGAIEKMFDEYLQRYVRRKDDLRDVSAWGRLLSICTSILDLLVPAFLGAWGILAAFTFKT